MGSSETTTTYRSAYQQRAEKGRKRKGSPSGDVGTEFERLLYRRFARFGRAENSALPIDAICALHRDARLTTYGRDFLKTDAKEREVRAMARRLDAGGRRRGHVPEVAAAGCCRDHLSRTAATRSNVKYTGAAPPEPYVPPRSEYWATHGELAGRLIAERMLYRDNPPAKR